MLFQATTLADVIVIRPEPIEDSRGLFVETFRQNLFCEAVGHNVQFVQENQSLSSAPYTIRGLHMQIGGHSQGKLIRCTKGRIFDVAVDARAGSPTFGQWVGEVLDSKGGEQLWIPEGFLHGFLTLSPNATVQYKCTNYYDKASERSVLWDDPDLNIEWPRSDFPVIASKRDRAGQSWASFVDAGL